MPRKSSKKKKATQSNKPPLLSPFQKALIPLVLVVTVGIAAAGYWSYQRFIVSVEQQQLHELASSYAQNQAAVVTQYVADLRKNIRLLVGSETLLNALQSNNTNTLQRFENELRNNVAESLWVKFYPRGGAQLDPDAEQPIRFAEIDMINRAEMRSDVALEASQINGAWRIAMVEPLPVATDSDAEPDDLPVAGVMFLFLSNNELLAQLGKSHANDGSTQLIQQFTNSQPQTLAQLGNSSETEGADAPIANTNWRIHFIPTATVAAQAEVSHIGFLLIVVLVYVALMAASYFIAKTLAPSLGGAQVVPSFSGAKAGLATGGVLGDPMFQTKDMLDVKVREEDRNLLGLKESAAQDPLDIRDAPANKAAAADSAPAHIFRAYDIRGDAQQEITPPLVVAIGQAAGSLALEAGDTAMYVARDGRTSSPEFAELLIEGILSTGCNVLNLGMVPTPVMNFAICEQLKSHSGVMVTASHNAANYNGFKIIVNGKPLFDDGIQGLRARIAQGNFLSKGAGREEEVEIVNEYIERIFSDVALAGELSVVIDAGNSVTGNVAPRLFEELGCRVIPLYCDVDGTFPNHDPDPSVDSNLKALVQKVKAEQADIGIALDGDGDRLGIVSASGQIVYPDRALMLLAKDIVSRNPGADVVFDVKSSRELNNIVTTYGGRPIMWKSGHSPMRSKMDELKALLGGEFSGHIFIGERWYGFDDGMYAAVRLLEIMSLREQDLDSMLAALPNPPATGEIKIPIDEEKKFNFIRAMIEQADFVDGRITTIDGLRVEFEKGWGLVRASNTSAALTLRFEADSPEILHDIQQQFKYQMLKVDSDLIVAF